MPHTKAEFDGVKLGLFKEAIASAAGTSPLNVGILSITETRRRAGSIEVETKIRAMDTASLQALSYTLGTGDSMLAKINAELTKRGLPASTVVSVKYKKSGLSDGAIAGMVIGSVTCAAILVGAAVYMTKMNNKTAETVKSIENVQGSLEVDGREVDGWMGGRWAKQHPLTREPAWDHVLMNTSLESKEVAELDIGWSNDGMRFDMSSIPTISPKDRQTKSAKETGRPKAPWTQTEQKRHDRQTKSDMDTAPEELEFG
jgi:hypothetical protein